ncbi:hypothetical protein JYU34_013052 [Plutella xylostella]|uniref:Uncharacterized protein n=2 Tax=Plutella xylostella TaxID=51655 RepID=A0ABQ7QE52_PLUXY|nr:hypothetical protein JYU34_013052 [Plutella xylostella]CAG9093309.1 unnamed protein product [Plutella xylostella]
MKLVIYFLCLLQVYHHARSEIRASPLLNRLANIKLVGLDPRSIKHTAFPQPTPAPSLRRHVDQSGRRQQPEECVPKGPKDYYDDDVKVATVQIPEHMDHIHYAITTPVPYLTVGPIAGLGYHPSTIKSEYPSECEKIYQDHIAAQFSSESNEMENESMEMTRVHIKDLADAQAGRGNWKRGLEDE